MLQEHTRQSAQTSPFPGVQIVPVDGPLGAEIRCGDVRHLDEEGWKVAYQAWLDNLVVLFRGQRFTDDEFLAFAKHFGESHIAAPPEMMPVGMKARHHAYIGIISNIVENGEAIGSLGHGEAVWHTDHSYKEEPVKASILHSVEVPATGGNTAFANMYLALETLDPALRERIAGLTIKNDSTYNSAGQIRRGMSPVTDVRAAPGPSHPIIRTHPETGHNALYLGRRPNAYVNGLTVEESEKLLNTLWAHATQPQFTWQHKWEVGDILVWDNRCVMHHRDAFDPSLRRLMHRTTTQGTRPYFSKEASGMPAHPRSAAKA